jgi:DnaJ-domain-containing protein 1
MLVYHTLYEQLCVNPRATMDEIKSSFRNLVQSCHPDKHGNSPESGEEFISLYHAYSVLSNSEKRKVYDASLKTGKNSNRVIQKPSALLSSPEISDIRAAEEPPESILSYLNFLLWEIEDLLSGMGAISRYRSIFNRTDLSFWEKTFHGKPLWRWVVGILEFIDNRVLAPAGFDAGGGVDSRANVRNYYYRVIARMSAFISSANREMLDMTVPGIGIPLSGCLYEAQNFAVHYLACIPRIVTGETDDLPVFRHSVPGFDKG